MSFHFTHFFFYRQNAPNCFAKKKAEALSSFSPRPATVRPLWPPVPRWQPVSAGRSLLPTTRKHTRRFRLRHTHDGDEPQHEPELADSTASDASVAYDSTPHWDLLAPTWRFDSCHFHSIGNTTAITCPPWAFNRVHSSHRQTMSQGI